MPNNDYEDRHRKRRSSRSISRRTRWGESVFKEDEHHKLDNSQPPITQESASKPTVAMTLSAAQAAIEKARKALELQKKVQEQFKSLKTSSNQNLKSPQNAVAAVVRLLPSAKPLRFDRLGRELDADGKVLDVKPIARSTLKVNINKERERKLKQVTTNATFNTRINRSLTNPALNKWFDPNLPANSKLKKKGLSFVEKGYYSKKEKMLQSREIAKSLGLEVSSPGAKENQMLHEAAAELVFNKIKALHGSDSEDVIDEDINPNFIALGKRTENSTDALENGIAEQDWSSFRQEGLQTLQRKQVGIIPEIEWWDQPLLKKRSSEFETDNDNSDFPYVINENTINDYVEHPVPIEAVVDLAKPAPPTLYLTAKEQTKLRRHKRQEKERDKRDKIRMGLIPPPPPTVRLSNLVRVLGKEAVAEPSRIEKEVLKQVEKRKKDHEDRNKARKLDAEARRKNTISVWTKMSDSSSIPPGGAEVCLFAVSSLTSSSHLYKVDKNAQQFHVTGACILCPQIGNMIVVEGNSKALKKYTNLLLRRIKWYMTPDGTIPKTFKSNSSENPNSIIEDNSAYCKLLWQGVVKDRCFKQWKIYTCKSESEIKKILVDRNADFYWDMFQKLHIFDNNQ